MESSKSEESTSSSFFGSPCEPIYSDSKHSLSADLLQDSLMLLSSKNDDSALASLQEVNTERNNAEKTEFKSGFTVLFLFELCKYFKLAPEVQYRAVGLFDRFMISHVLELYQHVMASQTSGNSPIQWSDVEKRLKHQIILRAVSCVQLASKLSSHYHLVTLNRARTFLSSCGFRYAATSVVQSEIRVLKTLEYRVHQPTPLEYIEVLLGSLIHNNKTVPAKHLHTLALRILNVFYLRRRQICVKLEQLLATQDGDASISSPSATMAAVETDKMLLAAGIIAAAGFILGQSQESQNLSNSLSHITCIVSEDITTFSSILLEEIFLDEIESSST